MFHSSSRLDGRQETEKHPITGEYRSGSVTFRALLLGTIGAAAVGLICPRCAFIEHGLNDPVPPPQTPEKEYPKIRAIYEKLGIPDRIEIEVHPGGHEVRMDGALKFLRKHL